MSNQEKKDGDVKLNWMYKGVSGLVDREDYLTGRKIDKTFEIIRQEEDKTKGDFEDIEGSIPSSILAQASSQSKTVTVDLQTKVREDPLYEIKRKEIDQKKKILNNPLKMRRLKDMLKNVLDSDSDSDKAPTEKRKSSHRKRHRSRSVSRSRSASPSRSIRSSHVRHRSSRDHHKEHGKHRSHTDHKTAKSDKRSSYTDKSYRKEKERDRYHSRDGHAKSKKLSAEELERKRSEMMADAQKRDIERKTNVEKYKKEVVEEEKKSSDSRGRHGFVRPLLSQATEKVTLEGRISQKRFTSQRGESSMSSNFARK